MRLTTRFGLLVIEPGDDPYLLGHKFFAADRDLIDAAVYRAMQHVHDGASPLGDTPTEPPELSVDSSVGSGGSIPAGARVWYTYSLVSQATGDETGVAPSEFVDMPSPVAAPGKPILDFGSTGGTLLPGQYSYVISAWVSANTNETQAVNPAAIQVPVGTVTNTVYLELPALPAGADGWNIYRRKPGGRSYDYIASVASIDGPFYDDDGILEDCDRLAPKTNLTNSTNAVEITYPTATPTVPPGYTWKIYRTVNQDDWTNSLLHHVVEETEELSGIITPTYTDLGGPTTTGSPITTGTNVPNPSQIDLTDGAHVQGALPPGMVAAFPFAMTFEFPGPVADYVGDAGTIQWTCPFQQVILIHAQATLGYGGSVPVADPVQVQLKLHGVWSGGAPGAEFDVFNTPVEIPVGDTVGPPNTDIGVVNYMLRGWTLTCDVLQDGGGATPLDEDLVVTVFMAAGSYSGSSDPAEIG